MDRLFLFEGNPCRGIKFLGVAVLLGTGYVHAVAEVKYIHCLFLHSYDHLYSMTATGQHPAAVIFGAGRQSSASVHPYTPGSHTLPSASLIQCFPLWLTLSPAL